MPGSAISYFDKPVTSADRWSVLCNQLHFDSNFSYELPIGPGTGWSEQEQQQQWVAADWCQAKWACQACAVLAPCLLSQLLTQSPVSSTLNGSSCCYSAPVVGCSGWLMNTFPNEGNSSPQSYHSLRILTLIYLPFCLWPEAYLSHLLPILLPRALVSIFLHDLIWAVPVHSLHTAYISLLSLADSHSPTVCHLFSFS